jgi:hypothetical protein
MSRGVAFGIGGLLVAVGLAALSPWASKAPDGLEHAAEQHGIAADESATRPFAAPMPNYWEEQGAGRKIIAGVTGTVLVFGITLGAGAALKKRGPRGTAASSGKEARGAAPPPA